MLRFLLLILISLPSFADRSGFTLGGYYTRAKFTHWALVGDSFGEKLGWAINPWIVLELHCHYISAQGDLVFTDSLVPPGSSTVKLSSLTGLGTIRIHPFGKWFYVEGGGGYGGIRTSVDNYYYHGQQRKLSAIGYGSVFSVAAGIEWVFHFFSIGARGSAQRHYVDNQSTYTGNNNINEKDYPIHAPFESRHIGATLNLYF